MFEPLSRENVRSIANIQLDQLKKRLLEIGYTVDISEDALDWLSQLGFDPQFGARPLKRVIQKRVMDSLSKAILSGSIKLNDTILIDLNGSELIFKTV